ncbi:MAG: hypothetical protein N3B16_10650 [Candidatus Aminicenantes bacterium]|nr:hypothetical protein [Candidatus Aminicenantes bacterium]
MEKGRLVYLAKNLKAFYLGSTATLKPDLVFLKKRFRYRRIAVLKDQMEEWLQGPSEPLVTVDPTEFGPLPNLLISENIISQILSLASLFMVPILSSKAWMTELSTLLCWTRRRIASFSPGEIQFVLRLLTYIPIDLAETEEEKIILALKKNQWANYLKWRADRLRQDAEKRFWRWPEEAEGEIRFGLVDPLPYFLSDFSIDQIPFSFPVGIFFLPERGSRSD